MNKVENDTENSNNQLMSSEEIIEASESEFERTPIYTALNASRIQRQDLIRQIEADTQRMLLCYVAGNDTYINRDDTIGFVEMLGKVSAGNSIDLLLHTSGGEVDAAEKIVHLLRSKVELPAKLGGKFRIIIPDYAKSAGTLIALGADSIVMSDSSELGTIDPQISISDQYGNIFLYSVLDYINAYREAAKLLNENPDDSVYRIMFEKFDPNIYYKLSIQKYRVKVCAEDLLKRLGGAYTKIPDTLMDTNRFPSHGQMIDWETAREIGLTIEYMEPKSAIWKQYWLLYCHLRVAIENNQKIFESNVVSYTKTY